MEKKTKLILLIIIGLIIISMQGEKKEAGTYLYSSLSACETDRAKYSDQPCNSECYQITSSSEACMESYGDTGWSDNIGQYFLLGSQFETCTQYLTNCAGDVPCDGCAPDCDGLANCFPGITDCIVDCSCAQNLCKDAEPCSGGCGATCQGQKTCTCTDSDGGSVIGVKGRVTASDGQISPYDSCESPVIVKEYTCKSDGGWTLTSIPCSSGDTCIDGACSSSTQCTSCGNWFDDICGGQLSPSGNCPSTQMRQLRQCSPLGCTPTDGLGYEKCVDRASCTTTCTPNWQCSPWGACSSSCIQTRSCTDLNYCGALIPTSKSCTGGSCAPKTDWTKYLPIIGIVFAAIFAMSLMGGSRK